MKRLLLLLSLLVSTSLISCGDDPITPEDPNKGRRSLISAFYAQYDQNLPVSVSVDDSTTISGLGYGQMGSGLSPIGDKKKIKLLAQSSTELATSNEVKIDSTQSVWVIYGGSGTTNEALAVNTPKISGLATTHAAVRFINASKNAPKVQVRLDLINGTTVTQNFVEYGRSSASFTPINITSTALVMVDEGGNIVHTLPLTGLQGGKLYTAIMYGNASSSATTNKLTAGIYLEPGQ